MLRDVIIKMPMVHVANHVDHEKKYISMHLCGSVPISYGVLLGSPLCC